MSEQEKQDLIAQIDNAIDKVRPHLIADGGNVQVIDITEDLEVKIQWEGTCKNCGMSELTLKAGLEATIKSHIPQIKSVIPINGLTHE